MAAEREAAERVAKDGPDFDPGALREAISQSERDLRRVKGGIARVQAARTAAKCEIPSKAGTEALGRYLDALGEQVTDAAAEAMAVAQALAQARG